MTFFLAIGAPQWFIACPLTMTNFPAVEACHWFLRFWTVSVSMPFLLAVGARFWWIRTIFGGVAFPSAVETFHWHLRFVAFISLVTYLIAISTFSWSLRLFTF